MTHLISSTFKWIEKFDDESKFHHKRFLKILFESNVVFQGGGSGDQQKAAQDRQAQVEDMKNNILIQVLSQEARARCKYEFQCLYQL